MTANFRFKPSTIAKIQANKGKTHVFTNSHIFCLTFLGRLGCCWARGVAQYLYVNLSRPILTL